MDLEETLENKKSRINNKIKTLNTGSITDQKFAEWCNLFLDSNLYVKYYNLETKIEIIDKILSEFCLCEDLRKSNIIEKIYTIFYRSNETIELFLKYYKLDEILFDFRHSQKDITEILDFIVKIIWKQNYCKSEIKNIKNIFAMKTDRDTYEFIEFYKWYEKQYLNELYDNIYDYETKINILYEILYRSDCIKEKRNIFEQINLILSKHYLIKNGDCGYSYLNEEEAKIETLKAINYHLSCHYEKENIISLLKKRSFTMDKEIIVVNKLNELENGNEEDKKFLKEINTHYRWCDYSWWHVGPERGLYPMLFPETLNIMFMILSRSDYTKEKEEIFNKVLEIYECLNKTKFKNEVLIKSKVEETLNNYCNKNETINALNKILNMLEESR